MRPLRYKTASLLFSAALLSGSGAAFAFQLLSHGSPVEFESRESLTESGGPVYNRIRFEQKDENDIWLMQQSHAGKSSPHDKWDRLALVVDKKSGTARYYQLEPGPLAWSENARELPFRVACYLCHASGPRAIRPNLASATHELSLRERVRLFAWNLRIKSYGALAPHSAMLAPGNKFRARSEALNEPLKLRACARCHSEESFVRAELKRQHFMPIRFLVKNQLMPPPGFSLSADEKRELEQFLSGLL